MAWNMDHQYCWLYQRSDVISAVRSWNDRYLISPHQGTSSSSSRVGDIPHFIPGRQEDSGKGAPALLQLESNWHEAVPAGAGGAGGEPSDP